MDKTIEKVSTEEVKPSLVGDVSGSAFDEAKKLLKLLTSDERMDVFGDYCKHCGDENPRCQCWNDE